MENKNDSFGKTRKQHSKTFATNFFDSLDFLNESLINNKCVKVSNKHCTETFGESTALLPEESVKKVRKRHKKKSSSIEDEEPAMKHITSTEEKQKRHKTKSSIETYDNESISVQNDENFKVLGETIIKEKRKRHKNKLAFKEHDAKAEKDANLELKGESIRHKNKLTSIECVKSVTNVDILGAERNKKKKKRTKTKSALMELDNKNIVIQNEKNAKAADLIELINRVKEKYERKSFSTEDKILAMRHVTNSEEELKKHKKNFNEHDYKSILAQSENNSRVLNEAVIKKKKKRKKKSAFKEHDIVAEKNTSLEFLCENAKHKRRFPEESIQNVTSGEAIGEELIKEKKKQLKTKNDFTEFDNENLVIQNEKHVKTSKLKKKKKHQTEFYDIAGYNGTSLLESIDSIKEDPVKKKKKHKRKNSDVAEDNDTSLLENIDYIQEDPVKKKKHKRKHSDIARDKNTSLLENIVEIQEDPVNKKKKHKRNIFDKAEDNNTSILENIDCIQEDLANKKKRYKRKNCEIAEDNNTSVLENIDYIQEDPVNKKKKHKSKKSDKVVEAGNTNLFKNIDYIREDPVNNKKRHKRKKSDKVVEADNPNLLENTDFMLEDSVKKMEKLKRELHTFGQVKNNVKKDDFMFEKPTKVTRKKYKLFSQEATDEYFAKQGHANMKSANKKENKQKDKSTDLNCNQSHKTQNDAGLLHISDNKIKKKVKNLDHLVQQSSDDEFEDCLKNSQPTTRRVKNKKDLMHTRLPSEDEDDELLLQGTPLTIDVSDLDLNEDPVDFQIPLLHSSEKVSQLNGEEKEALKSEGIVIKLGKFTKLEDSLLRRNYNEFTKYFHVNDPQILLGIGQSSRKKDVLSFLKAKHFYARLGKDLTDRPLYNIYRRARLLFNPLNKETKLDKADVNRIRRAHSRMGSKWQEIGNIIEKSAETARQAFLWYGKSVNLGRWTAEEENQLISAIKSVSGKTDLSNIEIDGTDSWEKVSNLVPTRNFHQCRLHWTENLSCKFKKRLWTKKDYGKLVSILRKEFYVDDFVKVNWKDVQKCFGDISRQLLRKKWYHLAKIYRQSKKDDKLISYKKMLDHYCIKYDIKTKKKYKKYSS